MEHIRMNRRRLIRAGLAATVALGATALPSPGWATTAGSHLPDDRVEARREDDWDADADDGHRGRGWTRASGQVIRTWNEVARSQSFVNGTRLSRILSMMHGAQHDAVNAVDPRYRAYASTLSDPSANAEAAAAASAHRILVAFFPANQAALDVQLASSLALIAADRAAGAGVALGRAVAEQILDFRATDRFDVPDPFTLPTPGPGVWEPTPPAFAPMVEPQFQNVRPFTLKNRAQFLPDPPPFLASAAYAEALNEVQRVGRDTSAARTADQTHFAHFWVETAPIGWSRVASIVSTRKGYDLHRTARLLALVNMAMADGYIASWYQKRLFAFWRPVTAIQRADTDGNPATSPDPSWSPLRPTPAIPDYPSTHAVNGTAAAEVLRRFTGSDDFPFCMASSTATPAGTQRCWTSFTHAALENAESRVMVGFHFRFATEAGMEVGRKIGAFAIGHSLRALR